MGSGFSGLGLAIRLKQQGFDDFVVLERAADLGGVWRDCAHPGSASDVESHLYAFSFAPNPHWTRAYSPRDEILAYLRRCVAAHDITRHLRFEHDVLDARWDGELQVWHITTSAGRYTARVLVAAVGLFGEPAVPELPGLTRFAGTLFHAGRWDHAASLDDRRVAVIGTGASAVQFIPELQPRVGALRVFQRTPAWVVPRTDRAISAARRQLFAARPLVHKLARAALQARRELLGLSLRSPALRKLLERMARRQLEASVPDPALRAKLTPSFRASAPRVLISDTYLSALAQPNVAVVTAPIREVVPTGIVDDDGTLHELDAIVLATGFRAAELRFASRVFGRDGRSLSAHWAGRPEAHLGSMVSGFPNFFLLLGPQGALGQGSVVALLERQIALILAALGYLWNQGASTLEPTKEAQRSFAAQVERAGAEDAGEGRHREVAPWASTIARFARRLRFRPEEYQLERGAVMQVGRAPTPPAHEQPIGEPSERSADTQENA